jgi:hypothetical protein
MKLKSLLFISGLAVSVLSHAQSPSGSQGRGCATPVPPQQWDAWFNSLVSQRETAMSTDKTVSNFTIPVIVHVIHGGQPVGFYPNLSNAQVNSQLNVLNADFSGTGYNVNTVPGYFSPYVANTNITFLPAQLDPNGNPLQEAGIDRVNWNSICSTCNPNGPSSSPAFQSFFDANIKPVTIWDPTRYLNIWVSDLKPGVDLLGYASFPIGTGLPGLFNGNGGSSNDGVWVKANAYGNIGSLDPVYNKGRTATHELGHWLGLRHIWGDSNCGDDFCGDTPTQQSYNMGCPGPKVSCANGPNGEMYMNFMDYCDDPCLYMFTNNQTTRMQTAMTFGTYRKDLTASSATLCNLPAQSPQAAFVTDMQTCVDSVVVTTNQSQGMPGPTYTWSAVPPSGVTFVPNEWAANPAIKFSQPGAFMISVTAANSAGSDTYGSAINVVDCADAVGLGAFMAPEARVTLFPNPATGEITVRLGSKQPHFAVNIHNSLGQLVMAGNYEGPAAEAQLDLQSLPEGIYTVSVESSAGRSVSRLVISR